MKRHKFTLDHRKEFDEVFVQNATVHVERMDEKCYWIGINAPGLPMLMINTGVEQGKWFFTIEEDEAKGRFLRVERKVGRPK